MSSFSAYEGLSTEAQDLLERLAESGQSEFSAVADCLNTIAENAEDEADDHDGPRSASDDHLVTCAREIKDAAQEVIDTLDTGIVAQELLEVAEARGIIDSVFSEAIDEAARRTAYEANRGGREKQIAFLIRELGIDETRAIIARCDHR